MNIPRPLLKESRFMMVVGILALLVLMLTPLLRMHNGDVYPVGQSSYELLREGELLSKGYDVDPLTNTETGSSILAYLLAGLSRLFNNMLIATLLPLFAGILTAILFVRLAMHLSTAKDSAYLASVVFIISPTFMYLFATLNKFVLVIPLTVLALVLFVERHHRLAFTISFLVLIESWILYVGIIAFFVLQSYATLSREEKQRFFSVVLFITLLGCSVLFSFFHPAEDSFGFHNIFVDFGSLFGLTIPLTILLFIGLYGARRKVVFAFLCLFILAFVHPAPLLFICIFAPFFAGKALHVLLERKWALKYLQQITLIIIICTLIFSSIAFEKSMVASDPHANFVRAVSALRMDGAGVIASDDASAPYIRYFGKRKSLSDTQDGRVYALWSSRDVREVEHLLNETGIDTFFITHDMIHGTVWTREEDGFLFLLAHSPHFINTYQYAKDGESYDVWVYRASVEKS